LFFHNYPSCTGQTRNVVFSRLAGRGAAARGLWRLRNGGSRIQEGKLWFCDALRAKRYL